MKTILIFFTLLIGGMIFLQQSIENGNVLKYIDEHPKTKGIPEATYYIGQSFYLFKNLPDATTYFLRVAQRYPDKPIADDAYFAYLQCLDDSLSVSRGDLLAGYQAYLEKYPNGKHVESAQIRVDSYRTGSH